MKVEAKLSRRTKGLIKGKEKSIVGSLVREQCTLTQKSLCSMAPWAKNRHNGNWKRKIGPQNQRAGKTFHLIKYLYRADSCFPHILKGVCADGDQKQLHCLPCSANRNAHWCYITLTCRMRTQLGSFSEPPCLHLLRLLILFPFLF